jgi:micrococcal nuclease
MRCRDGRRIRLLQIDAPERDQRPFGPEARNALARLAPPGTALGVELDRRATDRYGRTLAFLYLPDGRMVNEEMVRRGYAVPLVYAPNRRHEPRIRALADSAERARRGLHATGGFACPPQAHRQKRC